MTLTVFFDGQFWVGIFERIDKGKLTVARVVFGTEPKDQQVFEMVLHTFDQLHFSPPVEGAKMQAIAANPKRRQRQIARSREKGVGTKSQQAMKLAQEEAKCARKMRTRQQHAAEEVRKHELHVEKKKAKHRGH
ncbi:MAG: YjdF family protein [Clostridia bacterium]|nr:YjdF family protein [Clostridia bacterium]